MLYRTTRPLIVDAVQTQEPVTIKTEWGSVHAEPGEWLVRDENGSVHVCDQATFHRTFENLGDTSTSPDQLNEGRNYGC